jgi:peroxiredoxin
MLTPGSQAPALVLETLNHGQFDLAKDAPANGTVVVFFRGLHCPICMRQLTDLERNLDAFAAKDIRVIAISADDRDKTAQTAEKSGVSNLTLGYGLSLASAREDWGLYTSSGRPDTIEPDLFSEPGLFWIRGDGTVWFGSVQTMPFVRAATSGLLGGIGYVLDNDYPLRGNYTGPLG